ncbi:hypothetical protein [Mucilaginibacter terrae]|uniref:Uncharacterized protein n=1 Tax=Mucilaginibacter terrae TaxID=1955052 RepID=A0ABU3GYL8_9SPHI|nr:hypothetical protein [Mucilaginibacter terrae]MDT3404864.1 hypothetical protein [Mucilaginibacter terrae]
MDKRVHDFIESGILEAFITGATSDAEERKVLEMKQQFPAVKEALSEIESDLEQLAQRMAVPPPPQIWDRIESEINGLTVTARHLPDTPGQDENYSGNGRAKKGSDYIEVEGASSHMRIHKIWRWIFGAVFLLGKIFLGFAIYYYLENRQIKQSIEELRLEIRQLKGR